MKTVKPQKLTTVPFVEGGNCNQILMQLTKICRKVLFNISGTVTITAQTGPVPIPTMQAGADGTLLIPYLLFLAGKLTFEGSRKDAGKGIKIQNLPVWVLWLEAFILNKGVGPVVNDGGMQGNNFAPGVYNISISFPVNFFDPMTPAAQHVMSYFRPVCYNNQPYWQLTGGNLFAKNYQSNNDSIALTGDTVTPTVLTYTTALTVTATALLVPDEAMNLNDQCADIAYEYLPKFGAKQADFNGIALSDLEIQQYIHLIATNLSAVAGGGTSLVEKGSAILGLANGNIIETDEGTDQLTYAYVQNLIDMDYDLFMTSNSAWPMGLVTIDEYGHNLSQWQRKTFLEANAAQHLIQGNGVPTGAGANFRVVHKTLNLSQSAKAGQKFPKFAGQ